VLVFSLLFIQFFVIFFVGRGGGRSVCPRVMLVYPRGGWGNTVCCLVLNCLVC
jgi:hypothetical protein